MANIETQNKENKPTKFVLLGGCGTVGTDIAKDFMWEGAEAQFIDVADRGKTHHIPAQNMLW